MSHMSMLRQQVFFELTRRRNRSCVHVRRGAGDRATKDLIRSVFQNFKNALLVKILAFDKLFDDHLDLLLDQFIQVGLSLGQHRACYITQQGLVRVLVTMRHRRGKN